MAARNLAPVRALVRELIPIVGSFAPNGSSAVSASSRKGLGWSVARTSAGLFTITFTDKFSDCVSALATLQLVTASLDSWFAQIGTIDLSAKTAQIRVVDEAGAAVDVSANANNRINFCFWFRNSSVVPTRGT